MLNTIHIALLTERDAGNEAASEFVARIDAHIRDLETLKAWVLDSAKVRAEAIDTLIGGNVPANAPKPAMRDREADTA